MSDENPDPSHADYAAGQIRIQLCEAISTLIHIADDSAAKIHHLEAHITEQTHCRRDYIHSTVARLLPDISAKTETRLKKTLPAFLDAPASSLITRYKKLLGLVALPGHDEALLNLQSRLAEYLAQNGVCGVNEYDKHLAQNQQLLKDALHHREHALETIATLETLNRPGTRLPRHIEDKLQKLLNIHRIGKSKTEGAQKAFLSFSKGNLPAFKARLFEITQELSQSRVNI